MLLYRKKINKKSKKRIEGKSKYSTADKANIYPKGPHTPTRGAHPSVIMTVPAVWQDVSSVDP